MESLVIYVLLSVLVCSIWGCIDLWRRLNNSEKRFANYRRAVNGRIDRLMTELQAAEVKALQYEQERG